MSESRLEWKVGLFVVLCLAVVAALVLGFSKGITLFKPAYEIILNARNIGGLKRQAVVTMAGVQIGHVAASTLNPDGKSVALRLRIDRACRIHDDAVFAIEQSGFLGDQYVAITPQQNTGAVLTDGAVVSCEEPFNLQEVARASVGFITRVDETVRKLNEGLIRMDRFVLNEVTLTNLATAVANFRTLTERALGTVEGLDQLIHSNRPLLFLSVSNLAGFSDRLRDLGKEVQDVVVTNRVELASALKSIESSTIIMKSLLTDLQAGKGLAGSLLKEEQWKLDMAATLSNLSLLSSNLNKYGLLYKPKQAKSKGETRPGVLPAGKSSGR